jgi:hypothetical protein
MRVFKAIFLSSLLFISGCHSGSKVEKVELLQVLEEIHTCEAYSEVRLHAMDSIFLSQCKYSVLKDHKIDTQAYFETMEYYQKNPKEFEVLYDTLVRRLEMKVIN